MTEQFLRAAKLGDGFDSLGAANAMAAHGLPLLARYGLAAATDSVGRDWMHAAELQFRGVALPDRHLSDEPAR